MDTVNMVAQIYVPKKGDDSVESQYDEPDSYWLEYYEEAAFYGE